MRRLQMTAWVASAAFVFSCLVVPTLHAQETTGSLAGTVRDAEGKALVAIITLTGEQGQRTVLSEEDGRFLAAFLSPGVYQVTVTSPDHPTVETEVRVGLAQRVVRDFVLIPPIEETVRVRGYRQEPLDLSTQATGSTITTEVAESIPLGQNVSSMVFLAPGVKDGGGTGEANPSVSGSSGLENQYVFNGVNITNAGYGALGGYSIIHGSLGQGINYHFVEETQVLTGAFSAEHGQATGGIVNVLTKSGTNDWHGSLYGYFSPDSLGATPTTPDLDPVVGPVQGLEELNFGFDIGGPIVKDKAFFWLGANPNRSTETRRAPAGFPLESEGDLDFDIDQLNYAAKLTFLPRPEHRIDISLFGDPAESNATFTRSSSNYANLRQPDRRQFSELDYGGQHWTISYQGQPTQNFLIDASISNANSEFNEKFPKEYDLHRIIDLVPAYTGAGSDALGGIGFFENSESDNLQARLKLTNILGDHELSYGIGIEDIEYTATGAYTGPQFTAHNGQTSTTGAIAYRDLDCDLLGDPSVTETVTIDDDDVLGDLGCPTGAPVDVPVVYSIIRGKLSDPNAKTNSDYLYAFVQDDWRITPDFTLSLGLRWEEESLEGRDVTYNLPSEWSPRLGFSWDHVGEGRSKVYGHWGRFHEKVPLDIAVRLFTNEIQVLNGDYYDVDLTDQVPCSDPIVNNRCDRFRATGFGTTEILPGTRTSRVDEFVLGYQRQLRNLWTLKAEYQFRDLKRVLEDFQAGSATGIELGFDEFGDYVVGNIPPDVMTAEGSSFPTPTREYQALVLEATATTPRWSVTGQYTWSKLEGNYEGLFRNDNGQSDPNLTSLFDFPDEDLFYFTYDNGLLNTDRKHRFQAYGYYRWGQGWSAGSRLLLQSGQPKLRLASHPVYGNGGEISLEPRGSLGRTPTAWTADFNVAKEWELTDRLGSTISVELDVFNLFNHRYATDYDYNFDSSSGADICDVGVDPRCPTLDDAIDILVASIPNGPANVDYGKPTQFNDPREFRIGVKWKF